MTDIIQAKVLLVTPWNFSQFPDHMRGWEAYVEGVQTIFNDPNEPTGDPFARSAIVVYPAKYEVLAETKNKKRRKFYFLTNPHVNNGDVIQVETYSVKYQPQTSNSECHYDRIQQNLTQNAQIQKFRQEFASAQDELGLILHISHYQQVYMPGFGSTHIKNTKYDINRASLIPRTEFFIADSKGHVYVAPKGQVYGLAPGDIVKLYQGRIVAQIQR